MFGALFGSWYFETLYMQHVLGYSPLQAGLAFLPQTLLIAAGAQVTSRLVPRFGPRPLIVLGSLVAGGGSGLADVRSRRTRTFLADLFGPFVLIGLGMGLAVTPIAVAGTAGVRPRAGRASLRACSTPRGPSERRWASPRWPPWRPTEDDVFAQGRHRDPGPHRFGADRRLRAGVRRGGRAVGGHGGRRVWRPSRRCDRSGG